MNGTGSEINPVLHRLQHRGDPRQEVASVLIQNADVGLATGGERAGNCDGIFAVPRVVERVEKEDRCKQVLVEVGGLETLPLCGARQLLRTFLDTLSS
jgi:hypothetical protein